MVLPARPPTHPVSKTLPKADRLLVIRLGALGDVVRTVPAVSALRSLYPGAHLSWLVEPGAAGAVDAAGVVDETVIFPRGELVEALQVADGLSVFRQTRAFMRVLRRRRFDVVLDFHGILKTGLMSWLSGAPIRYGYTRGVAKEGAWLFANRRVGLREPRVSRFERNAALVAALAPEVDVPDRVLLEATPVARARLSARLRVTRRETARGFVLLHPGASRGAAYKRYPAPAWAEVARRLSAAGCEVWVASGAGSEERSLVDRIVRASGGAATPAPETRSFDDLLALLARTAVFASADTGPLHAASLSGVPVVQLSGPTDPVENAPWKGTPHRRVRVPLACSPCRRGCVEASCMKILPPDDVARAILELAEEATAERAHSEQGRS